LTGFSENNGVYTIRLKGNTAGTVDVNVAAGFGVTAKTITLKATAAQIQAAKTAATSAADSVFDISPVTILADGTEESTLTYTAKDSSGAAVTGLTNVTFPETGVAGTTVGTVTEANGVYTAHLTGTTPGVAHLTVSVNGTDKTPSGTHDVTLTPTQAQLAASVASATLTSDKDDIDADDTDTATLTFTPVDAQHNPVKGMSEATVGFAVTTTLTSGQYTLTGFSENNGVYTVTLKGNTAGTVDVNVAHGFGVTAKTITLKATAAQIQAAKTAAVSAADSVFDISPTSILADGTTQATLTFTAKDSSGAAVTGLTNVTFPETGVAGTTVGTVTEANGVYTAHLTGT
ncbi:invasin domain 3-containing protein, partial [Enterobacter roggenkampii]|uniref:invasin domain 3-containing protein n=1 Tax=Enterobacter roggenkampii TaxID=1812935 RepID=UPI002DBE0A85